MLHTHVAGTHTHTHTHTPQPSFNTRKQPCASVLAMGMCAFAVIALQTHTATNRVRICTILAYPLQTHTATNRVRICTILAHTLHYIMCAHVFTTNICAPSTCNKRPTCRCDDLLKTPLTNRYIMCALPATNVPLVTAMAF
jgi:hypothetical protein